MPIKRSPRPKWIDRALQGITYWIGHRRALYSGYALGESALVAELCNMIYTHLSNDELLRCEVLYTELIAGSPGSSILTAKARADIVVAKKVNGKRESALPHYVIEVKRASASIAQINHNLQRLAAVKKAHPGITAYLVLIAEADRPKKFVSPDGVALSGRHAIDGTGQTYRVRRVFKAAHAFTNKDKAQYACLVEVDMPFPPKRPRTA